MLTFNEHMEFSQHNMKNLECCNSLYIIKNMGFHDIKSINSNKKLSYNICK